MKLTRRALGKAAVAAGIMAPMGALAQAPAQSVPDTQRNWLAEARESHAGAARAMARVEVPMATEPPTRFLA